jgi:Tol biopolymer transport system component
MRVTITGEKPPEAIANVPAAWELDVLAFSPEGKRIAYVAAPETPIEPSSSPAVFSPSASRPNQVKVIAFDGGALMHQFDWPASAWRPRWAPRGDAIDYILTRNGVSNIWQQRLTGGPPKQVTHFDSGEIFDFEWSRDGSQLALTRGSESSDVILMSNFR